jgi:copper transport protein
VAAGLGSALLGHAGAGSGATTRVLVDATHLIAAATWSGAVLVFAAAGWRSRRAGAPPTVAMRSALRAFAAPAVACVALLTVTGVYLASTVVGSVDAALLTFYGRVLLVKLGLFLAITLLALTNHRRVRRAGAPVRLVLRAEAGFAVAVLAMAALLASGQPAREPQFVRPPTATTVPVVSGSVADLQQSLALRPNLPGRNIILVDVSDTRRPAPAPIAAVLVTVRGSDGRTVGPLPARRSAEGSWSASAEIAVSGRAVVRVSVRRPGLAQADRDYLWTVGSRTGSLRPATVSNAPIADWLRELSLGLAIVLAALLLVSAARARRSAQRTGSPHQKPPGGAGAPAALKAGAD